MTLLDHFPESVAYDKTMFTTFIDTIPFINKTPMDKHIGQNISTPQS